MINFDGVQAVSFKLPFYTHWILELSSAEQNRLRLRDMRRSVEPFSVLMAFGVQGPLI